MPSARGRRTSTLKRDLVVLHHRVARPRIASRRPSTTRRSRRWGSTWVYVPLPVPSGSILLAALDRARGEDRASPVPTSPCRIRPRWPRPDRRLSATMPGQAARREHDRLRWRTASDGGEHRRARFRTVPPGWTRGIDPTGRNALILRRGRSGAGRARSTFARSGVASIHTVAGARAGPCRRRVGSARWARRGASEAVAFDRRTDRSRGYLIVNATPLGARPRDAPGPRRSARIRWSLDLLYHPSVTPLLVQGSRRGSRGVRRRRASCCIRRRCRSRSGPANSRRSRSCRRRRSPRYPTSIDLQLLAHADDRSHPRAGCSSVATARDDVFGVGMDDYSALAYRIARAVSPTCAAV